MSDRFFFKYPGTAGDRARWLDLPADQIEAAEVLARGAFLESQPVPGQGPGEIESLNRFLVEGDSVYAVDGATNKVVHMTLDGTSIDDRRYEDSFETTTRGWPRRLTVNLPHVRGVLADATYWSFCTARTDGASGGRPCSFPQVLRQPSGHDAPGLSGLGP
ncbi:MAG: hypothetical protein MZV64_64570 [Ignavibacteriales bacterium]|nr:hypothetical protein [Ignavibacteriales bacterium]